jgi:hypothetical protein
VKRPEHPWLVALLEAYARRAGIDPDDAWAYVDQRKAPPAELRDAIVAAFFPRVPPDSFLPSSHENGTLRTMSATGIEPPRRGRPTEVDHPLFAALAKNGVTLAEEAKAVGRSTASIRSMCYPKDSASRRPAPDALQRRWLKEYGVPLTAWK